MKKRRFLLTLCAVLPLLLSLLLVSCEPPANTAIADRADKHITAEFTTLYPVREWGSDDTETPTSHTFLITDEETLNTLFTSLPEGMTVDFDHEMLVIHTYSAIYVRDLRIREIVEINDTLTVTLRQKRPATSSGDACQPYQRVVMIKLDKTEAGTVTVEIEE